MKAAQAAAQMAQVATETAIATYRQQRDQACEREVQMNIARALLEKQAEAMVARIGELEKQVETVKTERFKQMAALEAKIGDLERQVSVGVVASQPGGMGDGEAIAPPPSKND